MNNKITELERRKLEVQTEWNGKANVCIHCGRVPETFYIVTGHDHTDDSFCWCVCREVSDSIESLRAKLKEAKRDNELMVLNITQCGQQLAASQAIEQQLREALTGAYKALEAIGDEMTVGDRYTNAGQYLIDSLCPSREALALPSDTTALEVMIAKSGEDMRERIITNLLQRGALDEGDCLIAIRSLPSITLKDLK